MRKSDLKRRTSTKADFDDASTNKIDFEMEVKNYIIL